MALRDAWAGSSSVVMATTAGADATTLAADVDDGDKEVAGDGDDGDARASAPIDADADAAANAAAIATASCACPPRLRVIDLDETNLGAAGAAALTAMLCCRMRCVTGTAVDDVPSLEAPAAALVAAMADMTVSSTLATLHVCT